MASLNKFKFLIKKTSVLLIFVALLLSVLPQPARAVTNPNVLAKSALLVEHNSGTVLYEKNKDEQRPADSLTKVMALLVAVTECEKGNVKVTDLIKMTESAWGGLNSSSTTLDITPGEEMALLDLMYCAYTGAASEAGNMIAEHVAGSVEDYVAMMNALARELGCENTNFVNTHGEARSNQYTSAWDQYLIYSKAMESSLFADISGTYKYKVPQTNTAEVRSLTSSNYMLNESGKYYYRYCTGGKPSATYEGGYSLVASAEREGFYLVSVVLGSQAVILEDESTQMQNLTETRRLFEWAFSEFSWKTVISSSELVAKVPVLFGDGADFVNLRPVSSVSMLIHNDVKVSEFEKEIKLYSQESGETLTAPVRVGDALGEITLTYNGKNYGAIKLVANTSIGLQRIEYIKAQLKKLMATPAVKIGFAVLLLLFAAYIVLVVRYNIHRRRHMQRVAEAKRKIIEDRQRTNK